MKTDSLRNVDIQPFVGFNGITLGMMRQDVQALLGSPDEERLESEGCGTSDVYWKFASAGITLCFYAHDGFRLGSATFTSPDQTILGLSVIGLSVEELLKLGSEMAIPKIAMEEEFPELGAANYECTAYGITFWISGGVVENFTMYPRYDASGEQPRWPEPDSP